MATAREAVIQDLDVLLDFEQRIIASERPFDAYLKKNDTYYYDIPDLISNPSSTVVVIEVDGEVIGCGYAQIRASKPCHIHDQHLYLGFIYIGEEHRGEGHSSVIIDFLKNWGLERGIKHFLLDVYSDNRPAIAAYEKVGFVKSLVKMEFVESEIK